MSCSSNVWFEPLIWMFHNIGHITIYIIWICTCRYGLFKCFIWMFHSNLAHTWHITSADKKSTIDHLDLHLPLLREVVQDMYTHIHSTDPNLGNIVLLPDHAQYMQLPLGTMTLYNSYITPDADQQPICPESLRSWTPLALPTLSWGKKKLRLTCENIYRKWRGSGARRSISDVCNINKNKTTKNTGTAVFTLG